MGDEMSYEGFDKDTASTKDRIAWVLCQIIDEDAPIGWTRYRFAAACIAANKELMADLVTLGKEFQAVKRVVKCRMYAASNGQFFCRTDAYGESLNAPNFKWLGEIFEREIV